MFLRSLLFIVLGGFVAAQAWAFEEGIEYTELAKAQPTETGEKIEFSPSSDISAGDIGGNIVTWQSYSDIFYYDINKKIETMNGKIEKKEE